MEEEGERESRGGSVLAVYETFKTWQEHAREGAADCDTVESLNLSQHSVMLTCEARGPSPGGRQQLRISVYSGTPPPTAPAHALLKISHHLLGSFLEPKNIINQFILSNIICSHLI